MYLVDYHTHPYAHGEAEVKPAHNKKILNNYIDQAKKAGIRELGFSDHDRFLNNINWDNLEYVRKKSDLEIRLGLEVNYLPGAEEILQKKLCPLALDYIIGSVHRIGDWEVDHPDYRDEYKKRDINTVYKQYYNNVKRAAESGIFDIIGHLDLIKVFDYKPENIDILELVEPVLQTIKREDLVVEINTNGFNKPVQEAYPARVIIKRLIELGVPLTLGSDAHRAERVGENFDRMVNLIKENGCNKLAVFKGRKRRMVVI